MFSVSLCLCGSPPVVAAATLATPPQIAIERAVAERIGPRASVTVSSLDTRVGPTPGLQAVPDPGGRSGQRARFQLVAGGVRVGAAVAVVRVRLPHARAARPIARDETLTGDAFTIVDVELRGIAFRHVPSAQEMAGLKARRNIAAGEPLTDAVVAVPPLVRSGESVAVTIRVGSVEARGQGVASGSGHLGETIRVMQHASRRLLNARISGPGAVEVIP